MDLHTLGTDSAATLLGSMSTHEATEALGRIDAAERAEVLQKMESAVERAAVLGGLSADECAATLQVSEWSHLSGSWWYLISGVPGWACGHARQPSQPPREAGAGRSYVAFPHLLALGVPFDRYKSSRPYRSLLRAPQCPVWSLAVA